MSRWHQITPKTLPLLEQHASQFEPYCHFNIVDLWGYRGGKNFWLQHGDTIAYTLNDYMDNSYYVTLLGETSVKDTIREIALNNAAQENTFTMKCVPDSVVTLIKEWAPVISYEEDPDNKDYIFDVAQLTSSQHPRAKSYRKFARAHPRLHVEPLDQTNPVHRRRLYGMFKKWLRQNQPPDWQKEYRALKRALNQKYIRLDCLAFVDGKKIVGFTINSAEKNGYYQAFFGKADRSYPNLTIFQEVETAKYMQATHGSKFMNLQPDSGIEGLRRFKESLRPTTYLRKYTVTIDTRQLQTSA